MATLEENYLILDIVQVKQLQSGYVFTGKMKFGQLNQIYKLTERKESVFDPFANEKIEFDIRSNEFQRQLSKSKLNDIEQYLKSELKLRASGKSLALFPSSLILYNRSYEPDDLDIGDDNIELTTDIINKNYRVDLDCCFYIKSHEKDDVFKLYIPRNQGITLIVDGQHRFVGTQRVYNSFYGSDKQVIEDFEFIITYLVGFDLYEVGQIFATVNFNQKPVNRSLFYDIFGSSPKTDRDGNLQNDIRLAHELVLHLNTNQLSPLNSMIKLLGKGYGLFSQAFFVDKMIKTVFKTGIWDSFMLDYVNGGDNYRIIAKFIREYFNAIYLAYPSAWPQKVEKDGNLVYSSYYYKYILCKTTGLGAYFRLIKHIYPLVANDPENYKDNILKIFSKIPDSDAKELFNKDGSFGGAGSEGLQDKLYRYLLIQYNL